MNAHSPFALELVLVPELEFAVAPPELEPPLFALESEFEPPLFALESEFEPPLFALELELEPPLLDSDLTSEPPTFVFELAFEFEVLFELLPPFPVSVWLEPSALLEPPVVPDVQPAQTRAMPMPNNFRTSICHSP